MRNTQKSSSQQQSTRPSAPSPSGSTASGTDRVPPNAFSQGFLLEASRMEDVQLRGPAAAAGLVEGTFWLGPWEVEPVAMRHGRLWAVVRKGESLKTGGRAVAVCRHRSDALLVAATLPSLASPNHLTLGEKEKRVGIPIHDGERCLGHLSRPEPRIVHHLHIARTLVGRPESFALTVEALGCEEIPILGRALMRRIGCAGSAGSR